MERHDDSPNQVTRMPFSAYVFGELDNDVAREAVQDAGEARGNSRYRVG